MKILSSVILSLILLVFWSCSDAGKDSLSNDCTEELDCAGECGGTATIDVCGECDGSGLNSDDCCGDSSSCVHYSTEIQPIFDANCTPCHITSTRNNLSLSNYTNIMSGNSTNGPVIVSGDHANSLLWQKVNSGSMPPSGQLTSDQINLIATWIDEGALDN